jgi:serine/threonine protein kinase
VATTRAGPALRREDGQDDFTSTVSARYEILALLGQGGMGTVYRALDRELGREVALKVVGPRAATQLEAADERLLAEARILARLEHPGLVPVHDLGTLPDGRVFYAMKQVRGERLDVFVHTLGREDRLELLRLFERICETVAFAHAQGVIHRDLKPGNIMVGPFGEVLVLDWGLAKIRSNPEPGAAPLAEESSESHSRLTDDVSATGAGTILGTPGYMAPEQSAGSEADERSDVFALGALLRFLLTGSPEPTPGRRRALPAPLRAIIAKATAPVPADRYPRASEIWADLARFMSGAAVEAFPEGLARRSLRFARSHSTAILLVLGYLLVRLVLLYFAHR